MSNDGVNEQRRRFLTVSTTVVGAVGVVGAAVPFIGSWNPSAKAEAAGAPVKIDIGKLEPDAMTQVEWRGFPIFIVRRSQQTLENLDQLTDELRDPASDEAAQQPDYAQNPYRAREERPEIMVFKAICTHLGCVPQYWDINHATDRDPWYGGFFCPCHGSMFDLAGRVFKGVPAPTNLEVPPYYFESDNVLVIGLDSEEASA
ncbi:ubiquinol-cytochrome c reductase iron-sulfur subunit [Gilvimarinus sp. F26214L]|uniref:ubiquinol-cytochrome c reductase iron-sulfur subunit n=1 Tax=Gilvimarinus sp. DZF01 TaxID=3461371 RepID=UPI00404605FF